MSAVITGTPVALAITGQDPVAQNITVPADATAVYVFWGFYDGGSPGGTGLASATLNGASPSQTVEIANGSALIAGGCAVWYNPPTGTQSLDLAFDAAPSIGPGCLVVYTKDGDTSSWRATATDHQSATDPASATVTSASGDLVLKFDSRFDVTPPSLTSGWTNAVTQTDSNGLSARASYIVASGASTVCAAEDEQYSVIVAISIPAGITYSLEQEGYRWRDDNGDEPGASWLASQDSDITRATALNTRLRVLVNATDDPSSLQYQLEYKLSGGTYKKVEAAGGGSLAYGTIGAVTTTGTTAPTVAYPASIAAGDLLVLAITNRPNAQTPATPSGWTAGSNYTVTGGAGSEAAGTGTIRVTVFTKEADGTESGNLTLSITSGTSCGAVMWRSTKTTGKNWDIALANGSDNSAGTAWSVTFGSDPGVTASDLIFVASGSSEDTASFASEALSQTGITWGTMTERADTAITTGNDLRIVVSQHDITSGTSSAAATFTMTSSGTNSANSAGASIMIRLRQVDQPIQLSLSSQFTDGTNTTAQLTAPSGKSTSDFVAGELCESSNPGTAIDITADDYTEVEWCMIATANAANADVYLFRVTASGTALDTYTVTPQWTIGSSGGVTSKTLTDTVTPSDNAYDYLRRVRQQSDSPSIGDQLVYGARRGQIQSDGILTSDGNVFGARRGVVASESLAFNDSDFLWLRRTRVADDSITVTDGFVSWRRLVRVSQDTIDVLDGYSRTVTGSGTVYGKVMSDSVQVTDGFVSWRRLKRLMADNADIIDGFSKTLIGVGIVYAKVMSDVTTLVDDNGQRWVLRKSQASDVIGLSDALLRVLARIRILGEPLEFSDGVVRFLRVVRVPTENLDIADELVRSYFADQIFNVALVFGHREEMRMSHYDPMDFSSREPSLRFGGQ